MARIRATIDYDPMVMEEAYPPECVTKAERMSFDVSQVLAGNLMDIELIDFADDIVWEVIED